MDFIFNFLPKLLLALQPFLPFPPYRGCLLSPFSSPFMPLSAALSPRLALPAGKQSPVVPPALSCIPSCRMHGKPHSQKCTTGPAMSCCSCPESSWALGGNSLVYGMKKDLWAKGKAISSLGNLVYFGKLDSCIFYYCVSYYVIWCKGEFHFSCTWSGFFSFGKENKFKIDKYKNMPKHLW